MPKERCPVCAIEITHKNLARHIKLRHGIRYKFCYKCRKLVPGHLYAEHKNLHDQGEIESLPLGVGEKQLEFMESCKTDDEDDAIEIPEEMLDQALDSNGSRKKDETFRANTSMTKLESLMGKEFKHPRRKCSICGYSVSYSNFKRHLRNAHPGELGEDASQDQQGDMEMMGHPMDDTDMMSFNTVAGQESEKEEKVAEVEGYVEMMNNTHSAAISTPSTGTASKSSTRSRTISKCSELSWLPSSNSSRVPSPKLPAPRTSYWANYKVVNSSETQVYSSIDNYQARSHYAVPQNFSNPDERQFSTLDTYLKTRNMYY